MGRHSSTGVAARIGVVAVVLVAALLPIGAVGAAPAGSISGSVVDASDSGPLAGICVSVDPPAGTPAVTDAKGTYVIAGLEAGTYVVKYSDCAKTPTHATQWYLGGDAPKAADGVTVEDGDTALKTVHLTTDVGETDPPKGDDPKGESPAEAPQPEAPLNGVAISGTVTDSEGAPLESVNVFVSSPTNGPAAGALTAADGTYVTSPIAPGEYKVQFSDQTGNTTWAPQYWKHKPSWNTADVLTLHEGDGTAEHIDAQLTAPASVAGTVTGTGGAPVGNSCVDAWVPTDGGGYDYLTGVQTAPDGTYVMSGLPVADVRVRFGNCGNGGYLEQWYAGASQFDSSTPVVLAEGEARTGVDAQLVAGVAISGHVTDAHGAPIEGINVNVNPDGGGNGAWAQTDADGYYTTNAVGSGNYRVQFYDQNNGATWATQYWNAQPTWNLATLLPISFTDVPVRTGVDAVLTRAATVSGTVTAPNGDPAEGACATAVVNGPNGLDGLNRATVRPDGTYELTGLPAVAMTVLFEQCDGAGPWVAQWWNDQPTPEAADVILPVAGQTTTGIDARFHPAAEIRGHVTNTSGAALENICAQASSADWVGGMTRTDSSGSYRIAIGRAGTYRVQFVDCNETPTFAGEWWDDAPSAADATTITLEPGDVKAHVDAELELGAPATITGSVLDIAGRPLTGACVVAYIPNGYARFSPVAADGTYEITGLPSGTYALGALGCGDSDDGDPSPIVPSVVPGVAYRALWWDGVTLNLEQATDGGPDPIAQGATMVAIAPGDEVTDHDWCFGCNAVDITSATAGTTEITVDFTAPGLIDGAEAEGAEAAEVTAALVGAAADEPTLVGEASCTSDKGVTGTASGTGASIGVAGLTPGATYTCTVAMTEAGLLVAASGASAPLTLPGGPVDPVTVVGAAGMPTAAALAFTGANGLVTLAVVGLLLMLGGLVAVVLARRNRVRSL
jgi:hypothetical protein